MPELSASEVSLLVDAAFRLFITAFAFRFVFSFIYGTNSGRN